MVITLRKTRKIIKTIKELFFVTLFLITLILSTIVGVVLVKSPSPKIQTFISSSSSVILDDSGETISVIAFDRNNNITFDDLPDVFINALISAEDARFFEHSGIDVQRIISSFINNITNDSTQGASTLTQQLIKNIYLDSSKTLERKLNEMLMALKLEGKMSKEEIFLAYANNIMFDGITIGVNNASLKLFSKRINNVNIAEAALLAGIVNAPSFYNPIKNPDNAKKRMNVVLDLMYRHGYINLTQLTDAKKVQISDLLKTNDSSTNEYKYQSYLDIVYREAKELTGLNPLTTPLIIETYMDTDLQSLIDNIQSNKDSTIHFSDPDQQIAIAVVDNKNGALIAAGGGRNYSGQLLFNRAIDMKNQPASTMKPILSYALAIEHLNWHNKQVVFDVPYTYPGTSISVNNADHKFMGEILIEEALGYSRNTTAITTLEEVINCVGLSTVTSYLEELNLLDVPKENFNLSYALGAMYYGVSPSNLASAYSMLSRGGNYTKFYTIKSIKNSLTNSVIYAHKKQEKNILKKETTFILSDILKSAVNNNYNNLGTVKINNVEMHAKTGTSSFDSSLLKELNYPQNASKDTWMAGYSKDFTTVVWSGFDYPQLGKEHYFKAGYDPRKHIAKNTFSRIMTYQAKKGEKIDIPSTLSPVEVVRGTNLLPDPYVSKKYLTIVYYKKGEEPTDVISPPKLDDVSNIKLFQTGDMLSVYFKDDLFDIVDVENENKVLDFSKIYGPIEYVVEIISPLGSTQTYTSEDYNFSIPLNFEKQVKIKAYTRYANIKNITSNIYEIEYANLYFFNHLD